MNITFNRDYPMEFARLLFGRKSLREFMKGVGKSISVEAAEIGAFEGANAAVILRVLRPARLFCVDPYQEYEAKSADTIRRAERKAHRRLRGKPVHWVRTADRREAVKQMGEIDYLYIDGAHDYENVRADIEAYWPCVKPGGMMAGHDIVWPSVFKAVAEFTVRTGMPACAYDTDWWIWKPEKTG